MLLPSAHAGAVVELMPADRWGNMLQDLLFSGGDVRESLFRWRIVLLRIPPADRLDMVSSLLMDFNQCIIKMDPAFFKHHEVTDLTRWSVARQQHLADRSMPQS
jgi:hypothetical protein